MSQKFHGKVLPIAYASRTLSDTEINYATIEKELLAILFSVENFRPHLYARQFTLETDHRPLVWLHNVKNANSKLVRWRYRLNDYDYEIVYKKGIINLNADALSRNPYDAEIHNQCEDNTTLNIDLDPLADTPILMHKVLVSLNRTPVPSHLTPEDTANIKRIENAFLETGIGGTEGGIEFVKSFICQHAKDKNEKPDSSDEVYETASEYSDDENNQLIIGANRSPGREAIPGKCQLDCTTHIGGKAEINDQNWANKFLGREAIPGKCQLDCTTHIEDEADIECLNRQVVGRSLDNASWTALLTPVSGEDQNEGGGLVPEIGSTCNEKIQIMR